MSGPQTEQQGDATCHPIQESSEDKGEQKIFAISSAFLTSTGCHKVTEPHEISPKSFS